MYERRRSEATRGRAHHRALRRPALALACAWLVFQALPAAGEHEHDEPGQDETRRDEAHDETEDESRFEGIEVLPVVGQARSPVAESWVDIRVDRQPRGDGAEILRRLPGFAVARQGGIGNDPALRGLGGSRLGIVIDGVPYAGACNHGMDPATTYVDPGSFSELLVLHGPQSVRHAAAISGAVEFKRAPVEFDEPGAQLFASGLAGSFGQWEASGDGAFGFEHGYVRGSGSYGESDDYLDGDGDPVFSRYARWNGRGAAGWTPGEDTVLEASAEFSDGHMANPTIHMDATKLARRSFGGRFEKHGIGEVFEGLELRFSYVDVDHEMDDYTLRPTRTPPEDATSAFVRYDLLAMGQAWKEYYARAQTHFEPLEDAGLELEIGGEARWSDYEAKAAFGSESWLRVPPATDYTMVDQTLPALDEEAWNPIVEFLDVGVYAEAHWKPRPGSLVVAGFRYDRYRTRTGEMHGAGEITSEVLPGSDEERALNLFGGFARYEYRFQSLPLLAAIGIGHAERAADYWEVYSYAEEIVDDDGDVISVGGIYLDPEKNTELDVSAYYGGERLLAQVSFFLSRVDDFILTYNGVASYNVLARRAGGEAGLGYRIVPELEARADLSFVIAENVSESVPLAQTPPAEITLSLRWESDRYSLGFASRFVRWQNRIHPDHGNRLGVDTTSTPGFAVLSADAGFRPWSWLDVSFGIDNLLDHEYYEHLSRNPSPVPGYVSREHVNEPGQRYWLRVSGDWEI